MLEDTSGVLEFFAANAKYYYKHKSDLAAFQYGDSNDRLPYIAD